jgi:hypothetical protein
MALDSRDSCRQHDRIGPHLELSAMPRKGRPSAAQPPGSHPAQARIAGVLLADRLKRCLAVTAVARRGWSRLRDDGPGYRVSGNPCAGSGTTCACRQVTTGPVPCG